jgi:hypothetical protein
VATHAGEPVWRSPCCSPQLNYAMLTGYDFPRVRLHRQATELGPHCAGVVPGLRGRQQRRFAMLSGASVRYRF